MTRKLALDAANRILHQFDETRYPMTMFIDPLPPRFTSEGNTMTDEREPHRRRRMYDDHDRCNTCGSLRGAAHRAGMGCEEREASIAAEESARLAAQLNTDRSGVRLTPHPSPGDNGSQRVSRTHRKDQP